MSTAKTQAPFKILKPDQTFEGRSYTDLITSWSNWLVSSAPDYKSNKELLFLRGNLQYEYDARGQQTEKEGDFLDRTGDRCDTIFTETSVFVPILTAMYTINEGYQGNQMTDEGALRYAVRRDIDEGRRLWLTCKYKGNDYVPVIAPPESFENFYFETPLFVLNVARDSPLVGKLEPPLAPGTTYEAVAGGYFVIMQFKTHGYYRLHFGGFGPGSYYSDAFYDLRVLANKPKPFLEDVSAVRYEAKINSITIKPNLYFHMEKEDEIDKKSPLRV